MLGNMRVNPQRRSNVSGIRPRLKLFRTKPEVTVYQNPNLGTAPNTVTVYNRATIKGLIYPYYKDYSTVTEWGAVPKPQPSTGSSLIILRRVSETVSARILYVFGVRRLKLLLSFFPPLP